MPLLNHALRPSTNSLQARDFSHEWLTSHIYIKNAISIRNNPGMINAHLLDFCIRKNRMVPVFNLTG